jgi:hypothetical protein
LFFPCFYIAVPGEKGENNPGQLRPGTTQGKDASLGASWPCLLGLIEIIKTMITENKEVELIVRDKPWGVQLDVKLYPILCPVCNSFSPSLYQHEFSRYGYVGKTTCQCGTELTLTDSDNIVEYINIHSKYSKVTLNFKELYNLTAEDFQTLNQRYNYNIFQEHANEQLSLAELIDEVAEKNGIQAKYYESSFPTPDSVKKWKWLIKQK